MRKSSAEVGCVRRDAVQAPAERGIKAVSRDVPSLSISPAKVHFVIAKAREFDVKDVVTDPDSASSAADDAMMSVLEDHPDDPTYEELRSFIASLTQDEQIDLVALTWLGRGDGTVDEWDDLREEAARAHNRRTASYLLGKPMLADHLEEALDQLGITYEEDIGRP